MLSWAHIGLAGSFGALLVGWLVVVARGLYLARHLFTLYRKDVDKRYSGQDNLYSLNVKESPHSAYAKQSPFNLFAKEDPYSSNIQEDQYSPFSKKEAVVISGLRQGHQNFNGEYKKEKFPPFVLHYRVPYSQQNTLRKVF